MRVKLSYTTEEEDVLREGAKILGLSTDDVQQVIALFQQVQKDLRGDDEDDKAVNIPRVIEMMDEVRAALLNIDTRVAEVAEIVTGFQEYQKQQRSDRLASSSVLTETE
jgi:hypothetical protein